MFFQIGFVIEENFRRLGERHGVSSFRRIFLSFFQERRNEIVQIVFNLVIRIGRRFIRRSVADFRIVDQIVEFDGRVGIDVIGHVIRVAVRHHRRRLCRNRFLQFLVNSGIIPLRNVFDLDVFVPRDRVKRSNHII